ncbi:MAG: replication initiation protein [Actinobacteria bacterium]|nr:replication initiation protein [Actinomycetota bacterium]
MCTRPVLTRATDIATHRERVVMLACGSTLESKCVPCARKARRLRMVQCREGWHLVDDPVRVAQSADDDDADRGEGEHADRRVRSTRRRQDVPQLPKIPMDQRTTGQTFVGNDGKTYRPSMFLTVTLPSYGKVLPDGTPENPENYDYRRAALDALTFSDLVDRLMQNLRRCAGYKVQYFATVEPQRRLAPHLHAAIRGVLPREVIRQVVAATYFQLWWPPLDSSAALPVWSASAGAFVEPLSGSPLPTWAQALDQLGNDRFATPIHVARFGKQQDMQGVIAGSPDAEKRIGYLTKYLAKSMTEPINSGSDEDRQRAHAERLHEHVRILPCSETCANWLRYGVQPTNCDASMIPGNCRRKAHQAEHLGYGGRRVLVSRQWTGKALAVHRADRAEVVRQTLEAAGIEMDAHGIPATSEIGNGDPRNVVWSLVKAGEIGRRSYRTLLLGEVARAVRWRSDYERAKRAGPLDQFSSGPVAAA